MYNTIDREIVAVKIFSDSMASPKIKHAKFMCIINDSVVRGRLSENYLTRKFIARNICNAKCELQYYDHDITVEREGGKIGSLHVYIILILVMSNQILQTIHPSAQYYCTSN